MSNGDDHNIIENSKNGHTPAVSSDGRPLQRPSKVSSFKNRKAELSRLLSLLQPGKVALLWGMEGIGKTALAAEAVWTLAPEDKPPENFPDGIIYHSFYNQPQMDMVFETIVRAFGHVPEPTARIAARNTLAGKRALLLLDGSDALADVDKSLETILQVTDNCCVLVIGRSPGDDGIIDEQIELSPLEEDEAIELLQVWFLPQSSDTATISRICNLTGRLPLALGLAGRYLSETGETATDYLSLLTQAQHETLDPDKRSLECIYELLSYSLEQVSKSAYQLMGILGRMALTPIDEKRIAAALNENEDDLRHSLDELASYGLLSRSENRYIVGHERIHTYAYEKIVPSSEVIASLSAYYTRFIDEQCKEGPEGCMRLENQCEHIMRVLAACIEFSQQRAAFSLARALQGYLHAQGRWTEAVIVDRTALDLAHQMEEFKEEAAWLCNLGIASRSTGKFDKAIDCHEQALAIDRKLSNRKGVADNLGSLGTVYRATNELDKAVDHHQQALKMSKRIEYHHGEVDNLYGLGMIYRALEEMDKSVKYLLRALELCKEIEYRQGETKVLRNLGIAYRASGELDKAIAHHQQALLIDKEIRNRRGEAENLCGLGISYRILKKPDKAIDCHRQALLIDAKIGNYQGEVDNLRNLGIAYRALGEFEKAIDHHRKAFMVARKIGDRRGEVDNLGDLGITFQKRNDLNKAGEYFQLSLAVAREIDYRQGEADNLYNLGLVYQAMEDPDKTSEYLQSALTVYEEINSPHSNTVRQLLSEPTSQKKGGGLFKKMKKVFTPE